MSHASLFLDASLGLARRAARDAGTPVHETDALAADIARLAGAGRPFLAEGPPGGSYRFAAVLPRVERTRLDGVYEGTLRGFLRFAGGRRGGDVVAFAIGSVALGPSAASAVERALDRVARDKRTPVGAARHAPELGFPTRLRPSESESSYGPREIDSLVTAARRMLEGRVARPEEGLRMPWDGSVYVTPGERPALALKVGGRSFRVAQLPDGASVPEASVRAGEVLDLPPGATLLARGYTEAVFLPVSAALCEAYAEEALSVLRAFEARLDPSLTRPLTGAGVPVAGYNWLRAARGAQGFSDRVQALCAFPLLASIVPGGEVDAAIDARAPLTPALATRLGTSQACVRALRGLALDEIGGEAGLAALPALSEVEPARLPGPGGGRPRTEQWTAAIETVSAWSRILHCKPGDAERDAALRAAMAAEPPAWQRRVRGTGKPTPPAEVDDYLDAAVRHLVLPVALDLARPPCPTLEQALARAFARHPGGRLPEAARPFLDGRRLADVLSAARAWHGRVDAIQAELRLGSAPRPELSWEPLSAPFPVPGSDLVVTPLTTAGALAAEGVAMRHCVASYVPRCVLDGAHVLSIRRGERSLSTVHLDLSGPASDPYYVREHKAVRNARPPAEAADALAAYLDALRSGRHPRNPAVTRADPLARAAAIAVPGYVTVGYDPTEATTRDLALRLYGFALPGVAPGTTHASWTKALGLRESLLPGVRACLLRHLTDPRAREAVWRELGHEAEGAVAAMLERLGATVPKPGALTAQ